MNFRVLAFVLVFLVFIDVSLRHTPPQDTSFNTLSIASYADTVNKFNGKKIAILGDSVISGNDVAKQSTIHLMMNEYFEHKGINARVFSFAEPGMTFQDIHYVARNIIAEKDIDTVIIGLNYGSFVLPYIRYPELMGFDPKLYLDKDTRQFTDPKDMMKDFTRNHWYLYRYSGYLTLQLFHDLPNQKVTEAVDKQFKLDSGKVAPAEDISNLPIQIEKKLAAEELGQRNYVKPLKDNAILKLFLTTINELNQNGIKTCIFVIPENEKYTKKPDPIYDQNIELIKNSLPAGVQFLDLSHRLDNQKDTFIDLIHMKKPGHEIVSNDLLKALGY